MSADVAQVVIKPWSVDHIFAEGGPLFEAHYDEVARNKRVMVLDPDEAKYRAIDAQGKLVSIAAYVDGALAGYSISFIDTHIHYSGLVYLQNDVLFVSKEHRRGRVGLALIHATELAAKDRGARLVLWHAKQGTALDALMPRLGYQVQDIIYSREV